MSNQKTQMYCNTCKAHRLVERKGTNHILHLLLSLLTGGIWLIIWLLSAIKVGGWRCTVCGAKCSVISGSTGSVINSIK